MTTPVYVPAPVDPDTEPPVGAVRVVEDDGDTLVFLRVSESAWRLTGCSEEHQWEDVRYWKAVASFLPAAA